MRFGAVSGAALSMFCAGCAPALDWREVSLAEGAALVLLPCKPGGRTRAITLGTISAMLHLHACTAGGATWAVAHADLKDPATVGPALTALQDAFAENLNATSRVRTQWHVQGMTPNANALRLRLDGRLPDAHPVQAEAAFFVKGTRVFQATAIGPQLDEASLSTYFAGIRLR